MQSCNHGSKTRRDRFAQSAITPECRRPNVGLMIIVTRVTHHRPVRPHMYTTDRSPATSGACAIVSVDDRVRECDSTEPRTVRLTVYSPQSADGNQCSCINEERKGHAWQPVKAASINQSIKTNKTSLIPLDMCPDPVNLFT
jgi:hypothetical protein